MSIRLHFAALLAVFLIAAPAFGKSHNDAHGLTCDELWSAVKDTLGNQGNYIISSMSEENQTARFVIVGTPQHMTNSVALVAKSKGCQMKISAPFDGLGIDEDGVFRNRVAHVLSKRKAAAQVKPAEPVKPSETAKPTEPVKPDKSH
jgi:hypothetical protein